MNINKEFCLYCNKLLDPRGKSLHEKFCDKNPNRESHKFNKKPYKMHHKVLCKYCGKDFDVANISRHEKACCDPNSKLNRKLLKIKYSLGENLTCQYCGLKLHTIGGQTVHELHCNLNPAITLEEIDARRLEYKERYNNMSDDSKYSMIYHKDSVRSYRFKFGWYNNISCDSSWELAFVVYCIEHNIKIERNTESFKYMQQDGSVHNYFPDFIIDDVYYEIKGYYNDNDYEKIKQFNKDLIVIDLNNISKYLDYVISRYGKNFYELLYDKDKPSWLCKSIL